MTPEINRESIKNTVEAAINEAINVLREFRGEQRNEQARLCSIAMTELEGAAMWANKAIFTE